MNCLLCQTASTIKYDDVFLCPNCGLVFKNPTKHYNREEDFKRYATHNNNTEDQGYIAFLNKLLVPLETFLPKKFDALDFGCGPGPALGLLLTTEGRVIDNYDPIFFPNQELLNKKYDVVTSTEVVEHFKNPKDDWSLLVDIVKPGGILAIMTLLINSEIDYKSWWYKNDPTHVVFYQEQTLAYLCDKFGLEVLFNDGKSVIIFKKK